VELGKRIGMGNFKGGEKKESFFVGDSIVERAWRDGGCGRDE